MEALYNWDLSLGAEPATKTAQQPMSGLKVITAQRLVLKFQRIF